MHAAVTSRYNNEDGQTLYEDGQTAQRTSVSLDHIARGDRKKNVSIRSIEQKTEAPSKLGAMTSQTMIFDAVNRRLSGNCHPEVAPADDSYVKPISTSSSILTNGVAS